MAETVLPFLYRKVADLFKDESVNVSRDFRISAKEMKIVKRELAARGILIINKSGRKQRVKL